MFYFLISTFSIIDVWTTAIKQAFETAFNRLWKQWIFSATLVRFFQPLKVNPGIPKVFAASLIFIPSKD